MLPTFDGETVDLEAHLRKEGDVLLEPVVVVNGLPAGVEGPLLKDRGNHLALAVLAAGAYVGTADAFAVFVPRALALIGGYRAAP